jgi:hypothetical protein
MLKLRGLISPKPALLYPKLIGDIDVQFGIMMSVSTSTQ